MLADLQLQPPQSDVLRARLQTADSLREANKLALDKAMEEVKMELQQINGARQRIRQVRQLSKSMYQETRAPSRLQDWA